MVEQQMIAKVGYAVEALETVVAVLRSPAPARDKLTAARILLNWTMPRPARTAAVTIQTAEELLDAVVRNTDLATAGPTPRA